MEFPDGFFFFCFVIIWNDYLKQDKDMKTTDIDTQANVMLVMLF
jgi:hypothetical protein